MRKEIINTIYDSISKGVNIGIGQLYTEDEFYDRTTITFGKQRHVNFGSYSYLGLEHDYRLKEAAINAIERYGIQYPSSRTYVSSTPYRELEQLLGQMFQTPIILATTTTLAHVAVMPIVVNEGDVILMDQQVHSSVQFMISHIQLQGIPFHIVRHNNLENLEAQIVQLSEKYSRVWYMIDGVYSMYGDTAPMKELHALMNKHKKFHLYVDDAHGMSWSGPNGSGFALQQAPFHEKMILVTSLNKAFAAGGAVVVIPDPDLSQRARTCGGPFIFAGQLQMAALGAGIACANIHLSPEITSLQENLNSKIAFCEAQLRKCNLPFIEREFGTPIFFVGVGLPRLGYALVQKMIRSGQYVNLAIFPAVSATCTGIRFTVTCNHTFEQIEAMVAALEIHFYETLIEEDRSIDDIYKAFRKSPIFKAPDALEPFADLLQLQKKTRFSLQHERSIERIPPVFWDELMTGKGSYDWDGILALERMQQGNETLHDNWEFHYFILRNAEGKVILATYFTLCLTKDDVLAPPNISKRIEMDRRKDPYLLCSNTLMMGCPFSIGDHLYLDTSSSDWIDALVFFLEKITKLQDELNANMLNLRDIDASNTELTPIFEDQGFIKVELLDKHVMKNVRFETSDEFLDTIRSERKRFVRQRAIEKESLFEEQILNAGDIEQLDKVYELYMNVKRKSMELNIFDCPKSLFELAFTSDDWEIVTLSLRDDPAHNPIALAVSYTKNAAYNFMFAGLDYRYVESHDTYTQLIWRLVQRAAKLKCTSLDLGLTTGQNKRKFGAESLKFNSFVQIKDDYNSKIIHSMVNFNGLEEKAEKLNKNRRQKLQAHFESKQKLTTDGSVKAEVQQ